MSNECCLSVDYYIWKLTDREKLHFLYLRLSLCLGLFMSYLRDLFFIIIFIFVIIIHKTSLKQTHLFFATFLLKAQLRVLHSFCLFFRQFQADVAYKSVAYKKCKNGCFRFYQKAKRNCKTKKYRVISSIIK